MSHKKKSSDDQEMIYALEAGGINLLTMKHLK